MSAFVYLNVETKPKYQDAKRPLGFFKAIRCNLLSLISHRKGFASQWIFHNDILFLKVCCV